MMRDTVFINGRFLTQRISGVQRYAHEVIRYFDLFLGEAGAPRIKMVCLVPPKVEQVPPWKNIGVRRAGISNGNLWEQVDLPLSAGGGLLFCPGNGGPLFYRNQVVVFHDANVFALPEAYSFLFRLKYNLTFNLLSRSARLLLTDSDFSRRELAKHLSIPVERFEVVYLGGEHFVRIRSDGSILQRHGLTPRTYMLMVASQSRHKNLAGAVQAIKKVKMGIKFVMVGGSFGTVFQDAGLEELPLNIQHLGYVSDEELKALYENALGFILPSLYEGFGLPVLEAMVCGCPVLCANAASLPEVGGDAVLYFDPVNVDDIAGAIQRFLDDPAMQKDLREKGLQQFPRFSWEQASRQTFNHLLSQLDFQR
jgi:glycosyltransferase involved in cell wall biosynthesis